MTQIKFKYRDEPETNFAQKKTVVFSGKFNESKHDSLENSVVELADKITVFGKDFDWFLAGLNNAIGQIDFVIIWNLNDYAKGYFRSEQTEINYDKRMLKIKPILHNVTDALKGWDKERKGDFYTSVSIQPFIGTVETAETMRINDDMSLNTPSTPEGLGWGRVRVWYERGSRGGEPVMRVYAAWVRQVSIVQFDSTWIFDASNGKYVSPVTMGENLLPIAGARTLKDVIRSLLLDIETETGIQLVLKSHFFQWNESPRTPINNAYLFANGSLSNVMLVQNSDAKRPNSYDRAGGDAWKINLKKLMSDLKTLFNIQYRIENDGFVHVFRVEHCSFFNVEQRFVRFSRPNHAIFSKNVRQKKVDAHKFEKFQYAEGVYTSDFKPFVIESDGIYLSGEKINKLELLSCDIASFQNEANAEKVSDSGFVILAVGRANQLLYQNKPLSFGNLVQQLHPWNRTSKSGKINDIVTVFYQKPSLSTNDIVLKTNELIVVGATIQTDFGLFEIESKEIDLEKNFSRLKFG